MGKGGCVDACCDSCCRRCGRSAAKILYIFLTLLLIASLAVAGTCGYELFGDEVLSGMPDYIVLWSFILAVFLVFITVLGLIGTCYQARDAHNNYDGRVTQSDFHVGKCKWAFNIFIFFLFLFFCLHTTFCVLSLSYSGTLSDADHGTISDQTDASKEYVTETYIDHLNDIMVDEAATTLAVAPSTGNFKLAGQHWIDTQDYFECCGFMSIHPWHMTGKHCNYPVEATCDPASNGCAVCDASVPGNTCGVVDNEEALKKDGAFLRYYKGWYSDRSKYGPCSDKFGDLFKDLALYIGILAGVEFIVLLAGCFLCCSARTGLDVPKHQREGGVSMTGP